MLYFRSSVTMWKTKIRAHQLLCGLAATFAQLAFSIGSDVLNLGASGAIAGVLGAYILLFPKEGQSAAGQKSGPWTPRQIVIGCGSFSSSSAALVAGQHGGYGWRCAYT